MFRRVFSLIKRICFMIQIHEYFNYWIKPTFLFWFKSEEAQIFLIWVHFWILIWKLSRVFRGKTDVSFENYFWLPKSAQSAQAVENLHSFFNFSYTWYISLLKAGLLLHDFWCHKDSNHWELVSHCVSLDKQWPYFFSCALTPLDVCFR